MLSEYKILSECSQDVVIIIKPMAAFEKPAGCTYMCQ